MRHWTLSKGPTFSWYVGFFFVHFAKTSLHLPLNGSLQFTLLDGSSDSIIVPDGKALRLPATLPVRLPFLYGSPTTGNASFDHKMMVLGETGKTVYVLVLLRVRLLGAQDGDWTVPAGRLAL